MTITDVSLNGSDLFITCTTQSGIVSKYTIPWTTAEQLGIPGVIAWITEQGAQPEIGLPQWAMQLVGVVLLHSF